MEIRSPDDEFRRLVDDYRARCLWFLREDYYPETPQERERVLVLIAQHGDRQAFSGGTANMALTDLQRDGCRLLAAARRATGESYVAGGVALSVALKTMRLSRVLDVFHDTTGAVARSWDRDRALLERAGCGVRILRERPGYVEAIVSRGSQDLIIEWARDSAFRFFPLVEDDAVAGVALKERAGTLALCGSRRT